MEQATSVLRLVDFGEQYLSASITRWKMKSPSWFRCPTESVEVIELINGHSDGLAHLGAFERLQAWAVRNWKTGGAFIIRDRPMTISDIVVHCGLSLHQSTVEAAIPRVVDLGWVEFLDIERFRNEYQTFRNRFIDGLDQIRLDQKGISTSVGWDSTNGFSKILPLDLKQWKETHPRLDIDHELKKMHDWLCSNPKKRYMQYRRFITNWLNRAIPDGPPPITESGWLKDLKGETP